MSSFVSSHDRRVLLIGGSCVLLLVGASRGLPRVVSWEAAQRSEALAISERVAYAGQARMLLTPIRDTLDRRRRRLARLDSTLIHAESPAAAAALLASDVEEIAEDCKLKVSSLQIRADSNARGSLARVAVRIVGAADVVGLGAFLRAIETDDRPMVVRELAVAQSDPAGPASKAEVLRLDLLVETVSRIRVEERR